MTTKIAQLRQAAAAGRWTEALRMAARFPRLGEERTAILRAWNAYLRPEFYRQLRQDPEVVVAADIAALRAKYELLPGMRPSPARGWFGRARSCPNAPDYQGADEQLGRSDVANFSDVEWGRRDILGISHYGAASVHHVASHVVHDRPDDTGLCGHGAVPAQQHDHE